MRRIHHDTQFEIHTGDDVKYTTGTRFKAMTKLWTWLNSEFRNLQKYFLWIIVLLVLLVSHETGVLVFMEMLKGMQKCTLCECEVNQCLHVILMISFIHFFRFQVGEIVTYYDPVWEPTIVRAFWHHTASDVLGCCAHVCDTCVD